jgi:ABC-2 type transport system ATP-binding protein
VSAVDLLNGTAAPVAATRPDAAVPALVVRGVTHRFGKVTALDDVSLTVPQGAFSVLLGLNGAGKSTLFALVTRLYDNVTGEIRIRGFDVRRQPSSALAELGVVFQSRALDPDLSLMQNLTYHAALHGIGRREGKRRAAELLETVGLADRAKERVRVLSGGQARRVEIARSLLHRPGCIVLDEATVGLDIGSRESIVALVRDLVEREGIGVLWATHLIDEVLPSDHVVVLHKGRMLFEGSVPALLETTGRPGVREAFRAMTGPVQEDAP